MTEEAQQRLRLRLKLGPGVMMGPGKADVLRAVRDNGSISAAGRQTGMSYKRIWDLVNRMNQDYREPLVVTSTGGQKGGGATLTPMGEKVLGIYEKIMTDTARAIDKDVKSLLRLARTES